MKSGSLTSWNTQGHTGPVTGILYLYLNFFSKIKFRTEDSQNTVYLKIVYSSKYCISQNTVYLKILYTPKHSISQNIIYLKNSFTYFRSTASTPAVSDTPHHITCYRSLRVTLLVDCLWKNAFNLVTRILEGAIDLCV